MLLKELQEEYLLNLEILGRVDDTIQNHTYSTTQFIQFMDDRFDITQIENVRTPHLKQLVLHWKNDKKWAARTIKQDDRLNQGYV